MKNHLYNFAKSLVCLSAILALTACEDINTPNGEIPADYIPQAQKLMGVYRGQFNRISTTVILSLQDRTPVVEVHNSQNNDLLGANCYSRVGKLKKIHVDDSSVGSAVFEFNRGNCNVQGTEITLHFRNNSMNEIDLLESTSWENVCYPSAGFTSMLTPPIPPPPTHEPNCRWESRQNYITGKFTREQ